MIKILFLAANPTNTAWLRVGEESRAIDEALRKSEFRAAFQIEKQFAVRVGDLSELLLRHQPDIVHFSGHGTNQSEIILENASGESHFVSARALSRLFSVLTEKIRCVVLNACYSKEQAEAIAQHIDCVVGMSDEIDDAASISFSAAFYQALGYGQDVKKAFDLGRLQIDLENLDEQDIPRLLAVRRNPSEIIFVRDRKEPPQSITDLRQVSTQSDRCDFYQHIPLPPNLVDRSELLAEVRSTLLADINGGAVAFTSAIRVDALHGMGGIGKSVMARILCEAPEIQAAFPDGILWATLGQTPDLNTHLHEWIVEGLRGTINENFFTLNSLKNRMAQLLENRSCLLIIDDVWRATDVEAFQVGGANCRLLITTRDAAIAEELGAIIHQIPVMMPREAISLLQEWGGQKLQQADSDILRHIVERLGYLPLAIKLAGGQLRRQSPERWLSNFDVSKLRSRRIEEIHDSLKATFALSLDDLNDFDRELYKSLVIFKEDEATPAIAVAKLWDALGGLDNDGTVELLHDLSLRALLQVNPGQPQSNVSEEQSSSDLTVTLHDLLRDFIDAELGAVGSLRAQQALLNAYRQTCSNGSWASASDDGYLFNNLVFHLINTQAASELTQLVENQGWLRTRIEVSGYHYSGYRDDVHKIFEYFYNMALNDGVSSSSKSKPPLILCIRCALISANITSRHSNIPIALIKRALILGEWTIDTSLNVIGLMVDASSQIKAYDMVLSYGKGISKKLKSRISQKMYSCLFSIEYEWGVEEALQYLVKWVEADFAEDVCRFALHHNGSGTLTAALALLNKFDLGNLWQEFHDRLVHQLLQDSYSSYRILPDIVQDIKPQMRKRLSQLAYEVGNDKLRQHILVNVFPYLTTAQQNRLWNKAVESGQVSLLGEYIVAYEPQTIETIRSRLRMIENLDLREKVSNLFRNEFGNQKNKSATISSPASTGAAYNDNLEISETPSVDLEKEWSPTVDSGRIRDMLFVLSQSSQRHHLQLAETILQKICADDLYGPLAAEYLVELAQFMDSNQITRALTFTKSLPTWIPVKDYHEEDLFPRTLAIRGLIPYLAPGNIADALKIIFSLDRGVEECLIDMCPHLNNEELLTASVYSVNISHSNSRERVLEVLASKLDSSLLKRVIRETSRISDGDVLVGTMLEYASIVAEGDRQTYLENCKKVIDDLPVDNWKGPENKVMWLSKMLYFIDEQNLRQKVCDEALGLANQVLYMTSLGSSPRNSALAAIVPHLDKKIRKKYLKDMFQTIDHVFWESPVPGDIYGWLNAAIGNALEGKYIITALKIAESRLSKTDRNSEGISVAAKLLTQIAPKLDDCNQIKKAALLALELPNLLDVISILKLLKPKIGDELSPILIGKAESLENYQNLIIIMAELFPIASGDDRTKIRDLLSKAAYGDFEPYFRARILAQLVTYSIKDSQSASVSEAITAIEAIPDFGQCLELLAMIHQFQPLKAVQVANMLFLKKLRASTNTKRDKILQILHELPKYSGTLFSETILHEIASDIWEISVEWNWSVHR